MTENKNKKITNRFDEYEISSVFTESTEEYLSNKYSTVKTKFWIKCVLGPLLAINAYMSHWGPIKWPQNYYLLVFSIFFYYIVSYIFGRLSVIKNSEGNLIGQYIVDGVKRLFLLRISDDKQDYIVEVADSQAQEILTKKNFTYYDYFTIQGKFLEEKYQKHLEGFIKNTKK